MLVGCWNIIVLSSARGTSAFTPAASNYLQGTPGSLVALPPLQIPKPLRALLEMQCSEVGVQSST